MTNATTGKQARKPTDRKTSTMAALLGGLLANGAGHSFLLIVLPPLGRGLGFGDVRTGLLLSLSALLLVVAGPAWGHVCDRWGRRRVLVAGLGAAALFPAAMAAILAGHADGALSGEAAFALLLAARLVQSALSAGIMPAAQAVLADLTSADRRAGGMGMMGAAFGMGAILGGAFAWRMGGSDPVTALLIIAALIAAGTLAVWLRVEEPERGAARADGLAAAPTGAWPRLADIRPYLAITLCGLTAYSLLQQVTALRLQDSFGLPPVDSVQRGGAILALTMAVMVATQGLAVRWLDWSPIRLLRTGAAIAALAMATAALAPSLALLMAAMAGLGGGLGLLLPGNLAMLSLRTATDAQARTAGLNGIGQGLGMAAGPLLGAALHQLSPAAPYWAAAAILCAVCALTFARR
ncbi:MULTISPECIES: MFS transporter [Azospirillum]|uniref:MFS transporter n=2 Tax=Azospirillum brasilense TaxID=192 RepID=A0ABU4P3A6_AZOBR|nr:MULTISPECIES: MFS transporter [Azospirillum]MDW7556699.1 MFS transporter [Azospirillum brasilense]MDW7596972.1 MFS transporter [Azospirillum brasilense]MDW7631373.1 MFS transporter [Azospirillum brasilense]MDX5949847.1 MFS transporter [Azospirillum brasilense]TVZ67286.1 putative MFS family arabinose efflux permease [Azospirillum brasilense]